MKRSPSALLCDARRTAGLSARALAARAGVSTTTVIRIERGEMDPTFGMLARLLAAAGHDLDVTAHRADDALATLASLTTAVDGDGDQARIDWTRLRAFADWCRRHPEAVPAAIADPPVRTGTVLDTILAGFAELLADEAGAGAPPWTQSAPVPRERWEQPGTPAMRERAAAATPEPFRRRNIVLAREALLRDAA